MKKAKYEQLYVATQWSYGKHSIKIMQGQTSKRNVLGCSEGVRDWGGGYNSSKRGHNWLLQ